MKQPALVREITNSLNEKDVAEITNSTAGGSNKAANKGEKDTSNAELAEGYRTESGKSLQEAESKEFIIKPDGSKDFGQIDNIMPTDLMLNTDNGDYYTIVSALGVNSKREEKQKGTLIFDRSASLPFVSNDEPAQNGDISENVGTDAQSATEKNNAPMDTLSVSSENITQTTQNDKQESVAEKNNFKAKETTSPKTGAVTFESAIKTNLPSKVFSEVKKIAQKYGGTLSEAKDKTFRFKDEESRAKFEEESSTYIQNAKAQTEKENPKVENVKPAENKTSNESVAEAKEEKVSEVEKPKDRTTIFGSDEETTRDLLEAFGIVENAKENTVKSAKENTFNRTKENTIPADKFVNVIDDSDEALNRYFDELEKALKKTSANPMFNPEVWTAGLKIGLVYVQRGINNFADWAKKITETATNKKSKEFADELENWQPAIWEMLKTMPKIDKFSDKQVTSIANRIGHLYETGTTDFEDIRKDFIANIGEENTNKHYSLIKATYNGIERFFADLQKNSVETEQEKISTANEVNDVNSNVENQDKKIEDSARQVLQKSKFKEKALAMDSTGSAVSAIMPNNGMFGGQDKRDGFVVKVDGAQEMNPKSHKVQKTLDKVAKMSGDEKIEGYDNTFRFKNLKDARTFSKATELLFDNNNEPIEVDINETAQDKTEKSAEIKKALADLAEKSWNDKDYNGKVSFNPSKKFRDKVQELFGHDVDEIFITASDMRHIKSHHGENEEKRGQINITVENIGDIYDIINDFDFAQKENTDKQGNQSIMVMKNNGGTGYTLLFERGKKKAQVKTAFKTKKTQMLDVTNPKPNVQNDSAPSSSEKNQMSDVTSPEPNVQNDSDNLSNQNISQSAKNNKQESEKAVANTSSNDEIENSTVKARKAKKSAENDNSEIIKVLDDDTINEFESRFEQALKKYNDTTAKFIEGLQPDSKASFEELKSLYGEISNFKKSMRAISDELLEINYDAIGKNGYDLDFEDETNVTTAYHKMQRQARDAIQAFENFDGLEELEQKRYDKEIKRRANEKLKAAGLEGKIAPKERVEYKLSRKDNNIVEIKIPKQNNHYTPFSQNILDDFGKLTAQFKIKDSKLKSKQGKHSYEFENSIDAQIFNKALDIYLGNETSAKNNNQESESESESMQENPQSTDIKNEEIETTDIEENNVVTGSSNYDVLDEKTRNAIKNANRLNELIDNEFRTRKILKKARLLNKTFSPDNFAIYTGLHCENIKSGVPKRVYFHIAIENKNNMNMLNKLAETLNGQANTYDNHTFEFKKSEDAEDFARAAESLLYDSRKSIGMTDLEMRRLRLEYHYLDVETHNNLPKMEDKKVSSDKTTEKPVKENSAENPVTTPSINTVLKAGEFRHTKTGELIPSVELTERRSNDEFSKLNSLAKRYGGSYSGFAKKFLFKTAKGRNEFIEDANKNIFKIATQEENKNESETKKNNTNAENKNLNPLQKIVQEINEEYGKNFKDAEKTLESVIEDFKADKKAVSFAKDNTPEMFRKVYTYSKRFKNFIADKQDEYEFADFLVEHWNAFNKVTDDMFQPIYQSLVNDNEVAENENTAANFTVEVEGKTVNINFEDDQNREKILEEADEVANEMGVITVQNNEEHSSYKFNNEDNAAEFAKVLERYKGKKNDTDEIEKSAREALKAVGLENKSAPTEFNFETEKDYILVGSSRDEWDKLPTKMKKNISDLAIKLNGQKFSQNVINVFVFEENSDLQTFKKALEIYGGLENEQRELGTRRGTDEGHSIQQSEIRETADEGTRQTGSDKVSEEFSGQERQEISGTERNDTEPNAASDRSNATNDTGESSARNGTRNGVRGSESVVQSAAGDERGGRGISENVSKVEFAGHNFKITEDNTEIGSGGLKEKFKQNIAAIKLLKQLESEGRLATPSEQEILSKFNGWGTLANAFVMGKKDWEKEYRQLRELLTPDEYQAAKASITNAFYTTPKIASAIWKGISKLGFKGGRILDPSMGSGIFF